MTNAACRQTERFVHLTRITRTAFEVSINLLEFVSKKVNKIYNAHTVDKVSPEARVCRQIGKYDFKYESKMFQRKTGVQLMQSNAAHDFLMSLF